MPIFQDPDRQCGYDGPPYSESDMRKDREGYTREEERRNTEVEYIQSVHGRNMEESSPVDSTEAYSPTLETSDREELMQSIKRGESPTWVLNRTVS